MSCLSYLVAPNFCFDSYKCLKLFEEERSFEDSILQCKNSRHGALDAQLVQIESYEERSAVLHICRSDRLVKLCDYYAILIFFNVDKRRSSI